MTKARDIFLKAKSGEKILEEEISAIKSAVWDSGSTPEYHTLLAFGLTHSPTPENIEKIRTIANACIKAYDDDLLKACFTTGCIYWDVADQFLDEILTILGGDLISNFRESAPVAARSLAAYTFRSRSRFLLERMVAEAKRNLAVEQSILADVLVEASLKAATGVRRLTKQQIASYSNKERLNEIDFGMSLEGI